MEGRKEGRTEGRKDGRKEGRKGTMLCLIQRLFLNWQAVGLLADGSHKN
jgi:predicted transposase YdaD